MSALYSSFQQMSYSPFHSTISRTIFNLVIITRCLTWVHQVMMST